MISEKALRGDISKLALEAYCDGTKKTLHEVGLLFDLTDDQVHYLIHSYSEYKAERIRRRVRCRVCDTVIHRDKRFCGPVCKLLYLEAKKKARLSLLMKTCSLCKKTKPTSEFYKDVKAGRFHSDCKRCHLDIYVRAWREEHPERHKEICKQAVRRYQLKKKLEKKLGIVV